MPAANSTKRIDVEMVTATVADGRLVEGDVADAPVPWWSFTKTVLAAAALVLVDAGRLTLDTPLSGRRYTLRQLLQHRAGVPDYGSLDAYHDAVARGQQPWPFAELLAQVKSHLPALEPGKRFMYSNMGYLFVRKLIEDAAGQGIAAAISRLVLTPLGISNARFVETPADLVATRWGNVQCYHSGWVYHGMLIGSPAAAVLLLDRLMNGDLLSSTSLRAMQEGLPVGGPIAGWPWQAPSYGLGLMVEASTAEIGRAHV
jgi:D-alanyl-D-alanine carboxypeptidase